MLNESMHDAETILLGSALQILVAATAKAQLLTVGSLKEDTARWLVSADRSVCQLDISNMADWFQMPQHSTMEYFVV